MRQQNFYAIKVHHCTKMLCPFLVSQYYRRWRQNNEKPSKVHGYQGWVEILIITLVSIHFTRSLVNTYAQDCMSVIHGNALLSFTKSLFKSNFFRLRLIVNQGCRRCIEFTRFSFLPKSFHFLELILISFCKMHF